MKHRQQYPPSVRNFCVSLNETSPTAYRFIRQEFDNNIPHPNVIRSWLATSDIKAEPGILGNSLQTLRIRAGRLRANGKNLAEGILFDKMSIRKMLQWSNNKMIDFEQGLKNIDQKNTKLATETLVIMFNGVNDVIQIPVAYYFTTLSVDAVVKSQIVINILRAVIECGIDVTSVTFDALRTNPALCEILRAVPDIFSDQFNPSIVIGDSIINIIFDPSHMIKLTRNTIVSKKLIYDNERQAIKWIYFERLFRFSEQRNFRSMHKMMRKHIEYESNNMNVRLAVETISAYQCTANANAIEYLMNQRYSEFAGAEAIIKFIRNFNDIFDVFNTTRTSIQKSNPLKNMINPHV